MPRSKNGIKRAPVDKDALGNAVLSEQSPQHLEADYLTDYPTYIVFFF